jgi:hypothetical protein
MRDDELIIADVPPPQGHLCLGSRGGASPTKQTPYSKTKREAKASQAAQTRSQFSS